MEHIDRAIIWLFKNPKILLEILAGSALLLSFGIGFVIGRVTKRCKPD